MLTFAERVANGVALLDEVKPNWRESVDAEMLRMDDLEWCILGQVYGYWGTAQTELDLWERAEQERLGFEFTVNEYLHEDFEFLRDELRDEWIKQL